MDHHQPQSPQPKRAEDPAPSATPAAATDPPPVRAASAASISDTVAANPLATTATITAAALSVPSMYPPLSASLSMLLNEAPLQLSQKEHSAIGTVRIRRGPSSSITDRAAALALYSEGVPSREIEAKSGIKRVAFIKLLGRARKRGFVPGKPVLMEHVADAPRSGRPKKKTLAK